MASDRVPDKDYDVITQTLQICSSVTSIVIIIAVLSSILWGFINGARSNLNISYMIVALKSLEIQLLRETSGYSSTSRLYAESPVMHLKSIFWNVLIYKS